MTVEVEPAYLEAQSEPDQHRYAFSYTVTLRNAGRVAARLLTRHWLIVDGNGEEREVHGEGVVGEHPYLRPGETFRYTSGAVLKTPLGSMRGHYTLRGDDGVLFEAEIPVFTLAIPNTLH